MSVGKNSISRISTAGKTENTTENAASTPVEQVLEPALSTEITIAAPAKTTSGTKRTAPRKSSTPKTEKPPRTTVLPAPTAEAVPAQNTLTYCRLGDDLPDFLL